MRRERGFTIIELLIVVTIVGILSAIAIPVYQNYVTRAKIAEAMYLSGPYKTAVVDRFLQSGAYPVDNASLGLGAPAAEKGRYVRSVQIVDGAIVVTFGDPTLLDRTVTFTPSNVGTTVTWACSTTLPDHLRPKECA